MTMWSPELGPAPSSLCAWLLGTRLMERGGGHGPAAGRAPGGVRDAYTLVLGRQTALCSFAPRFRGISINYFCGRPNAPSFPLGRIRFGDAEITSSPTSNGVCSQSNYFEVLFMG